MLKSIHILLTYTCNFTCDHCFLYCGPERSETFTLSGLTKLLKEADKIKSVDSIGFEGGESFLYFPLLLNGVRQANQLGFRTNTQTNCYWAMSVEDAVLWLKPLKKAGIDTLDVSDDAFHHGDEKETHAYFARLAAEKIGLAVNSICIKEPETKEVAHDEKGEPIYLGGPKLRGRAVEKLVPGLPQRPWSEFTECPFEKLNHPSRVHIDPLGNVHICQGLLIGNMFKTPLSKIIEEYRPETHPICGPLLHGGPAKLAEATGTEHKNSYVDACHFCSDLCSKLRTIYPEQLGPSFVYGDHS